MVFQLAHPPIKIHQVLRAAGHRLDIVYQVLRQRRGILLGQLHADGLAFFADQQ